MSIVMGTAGHIDHGKTALVRMLTGIDCDRLEEEKRRGITIEPGFAFCELPGGGRLGIVDVPGHEKFVRNMVAGASGIDFVMLVVAADEGVMPQTLEHLEICSLLGIQHGLIALTKIDLVDSTWLNLVKEDIAAHLKGTFLENAPCFPVSSVTGEGIDTLREYIFSLESKLTPHRRTDLLRLPVDRIFTIKGHGTVVTGTLISGEIHTGENVVVLPKGLIGKARSLQSYGESVEIAHAGRRTAVNLAGLEVAQIRRGDVLARPDTLFPTDRWLLRLTCLQSSSLPLRQRSEVHFHHGAREIATKLYFFDRDRLAPGETALCEARLEEPLPSVFGDHCVVRTFSPLRTVAGGLVVQPLALPFRRRDATPERLKLLETLPEASAIDRTEAQISLMAELTEAKGVSFAQLSVLTNLESKNLEKVLQELSSKGRIFCYDRESQSWIAKFALNHIMADCLEAARIFHQKEPLRQGMARGTLAASEGESNAPTWAKNLPSKLINFVLERLLKSGQLVAEGEIIRLATHSVSLASDQEKLKTTLLKTYTDAGFTPPNLKEVLDALKVSSKEAAGVLRLLTEEGSLVKVKEGLYYSAQSLKVLEEKVRTWFQTHDDLDPAGFRELSGLSRKYGIALLEYFDQTRLTIRVGDKRQLRG